MCFPASVITRVYAALCEFCRIPSLPTFIPSTAITPADTREIVVSDACHSSIDHTHSAVDVLAVIPATGSPVQFVRVPLVGVPSTGVVRVGEVRVLFVSVCEPVRLTTSTQFDLTIPDPFDTILKSILVSHPVALIVGHVPVAAFVIVNSFTALVTGVVGNLINSLLDPSFILQYVHHTKVNHHVDVIESTAS